MKNWAKYADLIPFGDWHLHTSYTDGENTVEEMCEQAVRNGLRLLVFSEHVRRALRYDYEALLGDIERARARFPLTLLAGCETKVLDVDGSLDVSESVLAACEIVIASFHSFPHEHKAAYLTALTNALRHPRVDIWGHPTLFLRRRGISLEDHEIREVAAVCREENVLVEQSLLYGLPDARFVELAEGVTYVESSDAHSTARLRVPAGAAGVESGNRPR